LARWPLPAPCQSARKKFFDFLAKRVDFTAIFPIMEYMINQPYLSFPAQIQRGNLSNVFLPNKPFNVYIVRARYDNRDAFVGCSYSPVARCKTLGYAILKAKELAEKLYDDYNEIDMDDPHIEIRFHPDHKFPVSKSQKKREMWAGAVVSGSGKVSLIPPMSGDEGIPF